MADCTISIEIKSPSGSSGPLKDAWVYWRESGQPIKLLRTMAGQAFTNEMAGDPDKTHWWEYSTPFITQVGANVDVYFSRGAMPLTDAQLNSVTGVLRRVTVPKPAAPPPVPITGGGTANAIRLPARATITLDDMLLTLLSPEELSLWPQLWESPKAAYLTDGIEQGKKAWTANGATHADFAASPQAGASVRTQERGVKIVGTIDKAATGVDVQIVDSNGKALDIKSSPSASAQTTLSVTPGTVTGDTAPFECRLLFDNPSAAFGIVQVFLRSTGKTPPILDGFTLLLAGFQIALVDDHTANANGKAAGSVPLETGTTAGDEVFVIDFDSSSPKDTLDELSGMTRVRRMIVFDISNESRTFPFINPLPAGTTAPSVALPQMPMWMAELEIVGASAGGSFTELMLRRYAQVKGGIADPFTPLTFKIDLEWTLELKWNGQDINSPNVSSSPLRHDQTFSNDQTFPESGTFKQSVVLHFGRFGELNDDQAKPIAVASGKLVPNAFSPAPTLLTFPVSGRRAPGVFVAGGVQRRWGRRADNPLIDALLIEQQLVIALGTPAVEKIRGGNGTLTLTSLKMATGDDSSTSPLATKAIPAGVARDSNDALVEPLATAVVGELPTFFVRGNNPTETEAGALIDEVVADKLNRPSPPAQYTFLTVAQWQKTVRAILKKESTPASSIPPFKQYEPRDTGRFKFKALRYGHPKQMPLFGAPHGFGVGQLDLLGASPGRGPNADEVWSMLENVRSAVNLILDDKARTALNFFTKGKSAAAVAAFNGLPVRDQRAMLQRETVRRYNGAKEQEFDTVNDVWVVKPSKGAQGNLTYCNDVLSTTYNYGAVEALPTNQFGPGI